ncbi:50S ribosomal protein L25 [Taibaiella lutea]|uniref:Large ribosomal subunit protein bL25 n=1 Tax=Taibaiella lutea TaxID=2608001 RepID=A0A5M6CBM4_9BACT|nr:50S ribosomal protein L25 [Taibaiella lutea]KAA5532527.1 50S ribosomal protein L25 [Taibaiella lutea]
MKTVVIEGQLRTDTGKKAARDLRSSGQVLGVIYGGKEEIHFSAPQLAFRPLVYTPEFQIAEIKVDGKSYRTILKDKQFDVVTDSLNHIDFLELVSDRKVIANLPLNFVGQSEGVKAGGRLVIKMKSLKLRTMPENLVSSIDVDITNLQLNGNIRVEDVKIENAELMNPLRQPIASVVMTRALRQAETETKKGK